MPFFFAIQGSHKLRKFGCDEDYYEYLSSDGIQDDFSYGLYVYNFMAHIIYKCENKTYINKYINKYAALIEKIIRDEKICYIKTYEKILYDNNDLSIEKIITCLLVFSFLNENNTILAYLIEHHKDLIINASILTENNEIIDKILELSIPITDNNLLLAIIKRNIYCINKFLTYKFYPKPEAIINAIKYELPTETIIELLHHSIEKNIDMLVIACMKIKLGVIDYLFDCGIEPNNKCFIAMCFANYILHVDDIVLKKGIELLTNKGGYQMTNYDVCFALYCNIRLCLLGANIKTTTKMLEIACLLNVKINEIKHIVGNGAIPNIQCLRNACFHNSFHIADYLITKFDIKPDGQCLMNMIKLFGSASLNKLGFAYFGIEGSPAIVDYKRFENYDNTTKNKIEFILKENLVPIYNIDDPGIVEFITEINKKTKKKQMIKENEENKE